jgi:hypothetical protein
MKKKLKQCAGSSHLVINSSNKHKKTVTPDGFFIFSKKKSLFQEEAFSVFREFSCIDVIKTNTAGK